MLSNICFSFNEINMLQCEAQIVSEKANSTILFEFNP